MVKTPVSPLYAVPVVAVNDPPADFEIPFVVAETNCCAPVQITNGTSTNVGLPLFPILTSEFKVKPVAIGLRTIESVWNIGVFSKSNLTTPVDPVDNLVG